MNSRLVRDISEAHEVLSRVESEIEAGELAFLHNSASTRGLFSSIDGDVVVSAAKELANALIYLGAIGRGLVSARNILDKVKSVFSEDDKSPTEVLVLYLLIWRLKQNGSGATVAELAKFAQRSESGVRQALKDLYAKGAVTKSGNRFGRAHLWRYKARD